ncbi:MAG: acetylxylan esterase [Verrucomicrobiales bacterium]|nr:acetylxylan esterase [Verrucomicrobiales bacterium]
MKTQVSLIALILFSPLLSWAQSPAKEKTDPDAGPGDQMIAEYFKLETQRLTNRTLNNINSKEDWQQARDSYRRQLYEMLGLQPLPARSPLDAKITGKLDHEKFTVEKLVFESRPGLYVTGNLYLPKNAKGKSPAILYVCGHGKEKKNDISYGNKTHYQHHGEWFASNGYVCLTIDTLQLGEIEGIHHGTYSKNRWWWNARGYTPAGVEAWNSIRAIDYLQSRPEVDGKRIGITGRSGGGAYSWYAAALDERIKVAVPVAGITNLKNHVIDGVVKGHCDCMFQVNTYRWDYPLVAALLAPRPLLITNTDKDPIFPLDGVIDVYNKTRRIYKLLGAEDNIGLAIYEGGHKDTQPLRTNAFQWFERFLKGKDISDEIADTTAPKIFKIEQLKVLDKIPNDQRNTDIDEYFTKKAINRTAPTSKDDWLSTRDLWMRRLKSRSFRGWPSNPGPTNLIPAASITRDGITLSSWDFISQEKIQLRLYLLHREGLANQDLDLTVLNVLDEKNWQDFLATTGAAFPEAFPGIKLPGLDQNAYQQERKMYRSQKWAMAYVCPRGVGPTAFKQDERTRTHIRRRFMLLGQTQDSMQTWDIRRAVQALRNIDGMHDTPLWLQSSAAMAGNALYASLFEPDITRLDLHQLPTSHRDGPIYLNVLRFIDTPQAVAMAAERSQVRLYQKDAKGWNYVQDLAKNLKWEEGKFEIRTTERK